MTAFEKWSVWVTTWLVAGTGIGLGVLKYFVPPPDVFAVVNHPLQPILLKLHILTAPLLIFAVGQIALRHIWHHFRSRMPWGRRSGLSAALSLLPMVFTGYLIQVFTHPGWLLAMIIGHVVVGLAYVAGLVVHQRMITRGLPPKLCDQFGRHRAKMKVKAARLQRPPVPAARATTDARS